MIGERQQSPPAPGIGFGYSLADEVAQRLADVFRRLPVHQTAIEQKPPGFSSTASSLSAP